MDIVIYKLSAVALNLSGTESAHAKIAVTDKWLMVSI